MAEQTGRVVDVVVVGGGNAALTAGLAAREGGAQVVLLEKAPIPERGGNSFFTAGGFRLAHGGLEDLRQDILTDLSPEEAVSIELAPYAAHALSLAALRRAGYRPANRYIVFQALPHTLGVGPEVWRVLASAMTSAIAESTKATCMSTCVWSPT